MQYRKSFQLASLAHALEKQAGNEREAARLERELNDPNSELGRDAHNYFDQVAPKHKIREDGWFHAFDAPDRFISKGKIQVDPDTLAMSRPEQWYVPGLTENKLVQTGLGAGLGALLTPSSASGGEILSAIAGGGLGTVGGNLIGNTIADKLGTTHGFKDQLIRLGLPLLGSLGGTFLGRSIHKSVSRKKKKKEDDSDNKRRG